jgi:hypothetical protein
MRPPGEVRETIVSTVREAGQSLALRDIAQRSQVGYDAARRTLDNAVRCGVLEIVGHEKREHSSKWVALYDVPRPAPSSDAFANADVGVVALGSALDRWR